MKNMKRIKENILQNLDLCSIHSKENGNCIQNVQPLHLVILPRTLQTIIIITFFLCLTSGNNYIPFLLPNKWIARGANSLST